MTKFRAVTVAGFGGIVDTAYINPEWIVAVGCAEGIGMPWTFRRVYLQGGQELPVLNTYANMTVVFAGELPADLKTCERP